MGLKCTSLQTELQVLLILTILMCGSSVGFLLVVGVWDFIIIVVIASSGVSGMGSLTKCGLPYEEF